MATIFSQNKSQPVFPKNALFGEYKLQPDEWEGPKNPTYPSLVFTDFQEVIPNYPSSFPLIFNHLYW